MSRTDEGTLQVALGRTGDRSVLAEPFGSVLVLGPHRSRKTSGVAVPALLDWPGPALIASIREDVVEQTIDARRALGEVMIIDPSDVLEDWPDRAGWSPLEFIDSLDDAQAVARVMVESGARIKGLNENHWTEAAMKLLTPFLYAAAKGGGSMVDVIRWMHTRDDAAVTAQLSSLGLTDSALALDSLGTLAEREKSAIYLSLDVTVSIWDRQRLQTLSATEPLFRFAKFFNRDANTVYLCAPPDAQREYKPYLNSFTRLFLREVYRANRGFSSSTLGLRGPIAALEASRGTVTPLLVVVDDAGAVAPIPDLDNFVGTANKVAVQLVTAFTDMSQIQALYSEAGARTIVNNHSAIVVMPGNRDPATSALVDELVRDESIPGLPRGSASSEAVRRLPWGKALLVSENRPPAVIDLRSSLVDRDLLQLRGLDEGDY